MAYKPMLGGNVSSGFPPQFPMENAPISSISLGTTLIELLSNDGSDKVVSHGSGCFWRHADTVFLVTARHVVSGREPFENKLMSPEGFIPRKLAVYPTITIGERDTRGKFIVELSEDENKPSWLEDPEFQTLRTDIAAIPLPKLNNLKMECINDDKSILEDLFTQVGMDCAIVGYPTTSFRGLMTPIWRRGMIASEPLLAVDNKPMFLLDASTSPGFSGAPVFRRHYGPLPKRQPDGSLHVLADRIMTTSFVGIYAGRLQHSHFGGEVPFVFYANRLPHIFSQASMMNASP